MEMHRKGAILITIICAALLSSGCSHQLKMQMSSDFDPVKPIRVAVLPFDTVKKGQEEGAEKMRRAFAAHLQETNFEVAELAFVDRVLAERGWRSPDRLKQVPVRELGEALGVDAVVYGDVTKWDKFYIVVHAHGIVSAKTEMRDVHTGQSLWTAEKDAIEITGILEAPIIIFLVPIRPAQFALQGFHMDEMTDDVTREIVRPLADAARNGPSYAELIKDRPKPLSREVALALQKEVLGGDTSVAQAEPTQEAIPVRQQSGGSFEVQVCSTRAKSGAVRLAAELRRKGYNVTVVAVNLPGMGTFHRVRIPGFNSRDRATECARDISRREGLPYWVAPPSFTEVAEY